MLVFHSKVYISLFLCVLDLFLVQPVCGLLTSSLLSTGPFQRYKGDKETLELCKLEPVIVRPGNAV